MFPAAFQPAPLFTSIKEDLDAERLLLQAIIILSNVLLHTGCFLDHQYETIGSEEDTTIANNRLVFFF